MKKLFSLIIILFTITGCDNSVMVKPVGSNIKVKALNTEDLRLTTGDTVIIYKALSGYDNNYRIMNDFILKESWTKFDSVYGFVGREYHKAIVIKEN